jgi:hypothetical protein
VAKPPGAAIGAAAFAAAAIRGQAGVDSAPAASASAQQLPAELARWPATSTLVCQQGRRLSVVLRDADLDESQWPALRERLQAQCATLGLELAELMVNGVALEPAAPR